MRIDKPHSDFVICRYVMNFFLLFGISDLNEISFLNVPYVLLI